MYNEQQDENKEQKRLNTSSQACDSAQNMYRLGKNIQSTRQDFTQNAAKEGAKEMAKEGAKEIGKEAAKSATSAAAVTTGTGVPVVIGEKALSLAKKGLDTLTDSKESKDSPIGIFSVCIVTIMLIIGLPLMVITAGIHGLIGGSVEKYHEDQYNIFSWDKGLFGSLKSLLPKFLTGEDDTPGQYEPYTPLEEGLEKNIDILDKAFAAAYTVAQKELLGIIEVNEYDKELTLKSFKENEYPFSEINYAEIISIVSQKDAYNIEHVTFKDFKELFKDSSYNENLQYLYCMKVEEDYKTSFYYFNEKQMRIDIETPDKAPVGASVHTEEIKYGKVVIKHYDLKSLYEMLQLEPNEKNQHWNVNNIDMLEEQENYLRFYAKEFDLGPAARTVWDWGFSREINFASEKDYLVYMEYIETAGLYNGDISEAQHKVLEAAFSALGATYSMDRRFDEGYFDCSSLTYWCYQQVGIDIGVYLSTASQECKYLEDTGYKISDRYNEAIMQPGDLIFYSTEPSGKYKNITHTGIYVGDGKMIDASSSRMKVVYRDVWGKSDIVSVCRPLQ